MKLLMDNQQNQYILPIYMLKDMKLMHKIYLLLLIIHFDIVMIVQSFVIMLILIFNIYLL